MVYFEGPSAFNSRLERELRRLRTRAAQATDESCTSMAKSATESMDVRFCVREDSPTLFCLVKALLYGKPALNRPLTWVETNAGSAL